MNKEFFFYVCRDQIKLTKKDFLRPHAFGNNPRERKCREMWNGDDDEQSSSPPHQDNNN